MTEVVTIRHKSTELFYIDGRGETDDSDTTEKDTGWLLFWQIATRWWSLSVENRFFYLSILSLLMLGALQFLQPWQRFARELSREPSRSALETQSSDQQSLTISPQSTMTVEYPYLKDNIPNQGRPQGRLRGGGSR